MRLAEFSPADTFFVGVDPGQAVDPTAIAITRIAAGNSQVHEVVWLERLPLRTTYPQIVAEVMRHVSGPLLRSATTEVVLDVTGVGRPVRDLFVERGLDPVCITITGGSMAAAETEPGFWSVPKVT